MKFTNKLIGYNYGSGTPYGFLEEYYWGRPTRPVDIPTKLEDVLNPVYYYRCNCTYYTYGGNVNRINNDGVFEMDLPGADDLKVTTTHTKMRVAGKVKGKDYSLEVYIPERFQGSTPTGSYRKGVLRVEFEPSGETEVELTLD